MKKYGRKSKVGLIAGGSGVTPMLQVIQSVLTDPDDDTELSPSEATQYRANVARGNFMSQDRSDIQYAVKELSRGMAAPTRRELRKLKRLARDLSGAQRVKLMSKLQL